jgi:hypothetical protein
VADTPKRPLRVYVTPVEPGTPGALDFLTAAGERLFVTAPTGGDDYEAAAWEAMNSGPWQPATAAAVASAPPANAREPYVPKRPAERALWQARWRHMRVVLHEIGHDYKALRKHLKSFKHAGLDCSEKTIARIVRAGRASLLD